MLVQAFSSRIWVLLALLALVHGLHMGSMELDAGPMAIPEPEGAEPEMGSQDDELSGQDEAIDSASGALYLPNERSEIGDDMAVPEEENEDISGASGLEALESGDEPEPDSSGGDWVDTYSFAKKISGRFWRRIKSRRRQIR